MDILAK